MQLSDLMIAPQDWWPEPPDRPMAFVDLERCAPDSCIVLPPFPLIGLGSPQHPLAAALDAVVEPPVLAEALIRGVAQAPKAAAIAVQLLRSLDGLEPHRALTLESMAYGLLQGGEEHETWLAARAPARPAAPGRVRLERSGDVLHIVLDRPDALNAIDSAMRDQLLDAFMLADADRDIAAIKLRAEGAAFSIGGDLNEFGTTRDPAAAFLIRAQTLPARALLPRADALDVHVQGACLGAGIEMAAFARRVTATPGAWFQLPELAMGLIPGAGGCVSLPRRIGRRRTALMLLSGRRIGANTALAWGLIDEIAASAD